MEDNILAIVEPLGIYFRHYIAYINQDMHEIEKVFTLPVPPFDLKKYEKDSLVILYSENKIFYKISEDDCQDIIDSMTRYYDLGA